MATVVTFPGILPFKPHYILEVHFNRPNHNQLTDQQTDQPTNQLTDWQTERPTNKLSNQLTKKQPTNQLTNQPTNQLDPMRV